MTMKLPNQIALVLAAFGALTAVASAFVPQPAASALAVASLVFGAAAIRAARPARAESPKVPALVLGGITGIATGVMGLLLAAALLARTGAFVFLGAPPAYLAGHFTVVTGPAMALLSLAAAAAALGFIAPRRAPPLWRHAVTGPVELVLAVLALLVVSGAMPGEPWHAPYYVAIAMLAVYIDALWWLGLPTPREFGETLETGEAKENIKNTVRTAAFAGNGLAVVLAAASAVGAAVGDDHAAGWLLLGSLLSLIASTHAASLHRKLTPISLESDPDLAKYQLLQMRVMSWILTGAVTVAGAASSIALLALGQDSGVLVDLAGYWPYATGVFLAVAAGVNIARARLPSRERYTPGRRGATTVIMGLLATTAFFAQLQTQAIIQGPIVQETLAPALHLATAALAAAYAMVRGLYPQPFALPGSRLAFGAQGKAPESTADLASKMQRTMLMVYILSGAFLVGAVGLLVALGLGVITLPSFGAPKSNAAFFILVAIGLVMLLGLGAVFLQSRRTANVGPTPLKFIRRKTTAEVLKYTMLGLSFTLSAILLTIGALVWARQITQLGPLALQWYHMTDFIVFGLVIGLGPAGFLHNRERSRIRAIDERLPDLLRDLAESQRSGMTLTHAVITASKGNYGQLTPEIQKMAAQIEWGISFEEAFQRFASRVRTPLATRSVSLIVEASKAGGNVVDVLTAASEDARELYQIQSERRRSMSTYVIIIYVAFFVFLGVIGVLNAQFMPNVAKAAEGAAGAKLGGITFKPFDLQKFQTLFFHAAIVQGFGGGFVAGAMEEGRPMGGLRHAFILTIIAYVAFRFLIGG